MLRTFLIEEIILKNLTFSKIHTIIQLIYGYNQFGKQYNN